MAQDKIAISETPPLPGLQLVQQANAALESIATDFAGDDDPAAVAGPLMKWADTANGLLKRRNAAGTAWITEGTLFQQSVDTFTEDTMPTSDQGSINVEGFGLLEYDGTLYNRYISVEPLHGQCRFDMSTTTQCVLSALNGNHLVINGRTRKIPGGGVSISNTGLLANTLYYFYSYMEGATMKLEASTTAFGTNDDGVVILPGDMSRTLVGKAYTDASGNFADSTSPRLTASYFNRRPTNFNVFVTAASFASTTDVLVGNGRAIAWSGDSMKFSIDGFGTANQAVSGVTLTMYINGISTGRTAAYTNPGVNYSCGFARSVSVKVNSEQPNLLQVYGRVGTSGPTATINAMDLNALVNI